MASTATDLLARFRVTHGEAAGLVGRDTAEGNVPELAPDELEDRAKDALARGPPSSPRPRSCCGRPTATPCSSCCRRWTPPARTP